MLLAKIRLRRSSGPINSRSDSRPLPTPGRSSDFEDLSRELGVKKPHFGAEKSRVFAALQVSREQRSALE